MASTQMKILAGAAALVLLSGGAVVGYKAIAPPPARTIVITPEQKVTNLAEPTWRKTFNQLYSLAPGQTVKIVSPPMIPERQQYWDSVQNGRHWQLPKEASFTFRDTGSEIKWGSLSLAPNNLSMALQTGALLKGWEVDGSIPMGMPFPGDWVIRDKATPQEIMDALAGLVSERLGRQVRFVRRTVIREAIIARGAYKFVPLPGYANDNAVQLTDGKKMENMPQAFTSEMRVSELLDRISMYENKKVIDETGCGNVKVKTRDQQAYWDTAALLRNIAAQTSIRLDHEPREMDVWFMVDSNGTTLPTTRP